MVLDYDKEYVCKYCGSENVNEYLDEELDYLTFRCENCFHEEDNIKDILIEKEKYIKNNITYRDILKTVIKENLASIAHIIKLKNGIIEICIYDDKDNSMDLYVDEENKAFDIPEVMADSFNCNLMLDIIKTMLRWKFEYIDNL